MEYSAGPACARAHRGDCRDEPDPEEAVLGRHQSDDSQREPDASDASACVRQGGGADAVPPLRALLDADAGRSAGRAQDAQERDARSPSERQIARQEPVAAAELCRPDEAQSEERSCVAPEVAVVRRRVARDAALALEPERLAAAELRQRRPEAPAEPEVVEARPQQAAARVSPGVAQRLAVPEAALAPRQASRPSAAQLRDAPAQQVPPEESVVARQTPVSVREEPQLAWPR